MKTEEKFKSNSAYEMYQLLSRKMTDEQLDEIRILIANYLLKRADKEIEKAWEERGYSEETINKWLNKE